MGRRNALLLLLTPWLAAGCAEEKDERVPIPPFSACEAAVFDTDQPVASEGTSLTLGGLPLLAHGVGSYPLLEHAGRGRLDRVRDVLAQARALGRPLIRTNAFWDGGESDGRLRDEDGTIREAGLVGLDTLLDEARRAQVRLLLVLTNYWEDYGGARAVLDAVAPGEDLPTDAFFSDPRAVQAQRAYVQTLVSRINTINGSAYAEDPTIFAWELINEARCQDRRVCDRDTLPTWASQMSDAIREAGALQLVAWGGSGYADGYGERLADIGLHGGVDILTAHVYPLSLHPELLLEPRDERIADAIDYGARHMLRAIEIAESLDMPMLVEELGFAPPDEVDRDAERAEVYRAWLALAHAHEVATLPWMIAEAGREDFDGYLIREDDKSTLDVLRCE